MEFKKEKCVGGKFSKWRLTGLARLTDNALGQKLSMFMTGKANKPRCFKNLKHFSCRYRSQKKVGWTVIREQDNKFEGQNRKVLLILDNFLPTLKLVV